MPPHTARHFDIEFNHLRECVARMSSLVAGQWRDTLECLMQSGEAAAPQQPLDAGGTVLDGDICIVDTLVERVFIAERDVNRLQILIHRLCNQLIVRHQPLAVDLREVISILHMVNDFERVGDEAKKSALRIQRCGARFDGTMKRAIEEMATEAMAMLDSAFAAFLQYDPSASASMQQRDRALDQRRRELADVLLDRIRQEPALASACLDLIMVTGSVERVGDHARNVARYVVTVVSGVDRRAVVETEGLRAPTAAHAPGLRSVDRPLAVSGADLATVPVAHLPARTQPQTQAA